MTQRKKRPIVTRQAAVAELETFFGHTLGVSAIDPQSMEVHTGGAAQHWPTAKECADVVTCRVVSAALRELPTEYVGILKLCYGPPSGRLDAEDRATMARKVSLARGNAVGALAAARRRAARALTDKELTKVVQAVAEAEGAYLDVRCRHAAAAAERASARRARAGGRRAELLAWTRRKRPTRAERRVLEVADWLEAGGFVDPLRMVAVSAPIGAGGAS